MTLSTAAPVIVPTTPSREPSAAAVAAAREPPSSWVRDRSRSLALGRCSVSVSGGAGCDTGTGGGAEPVLGVVRSSAGWCVMFPESVAIVFVRGTNEQEQGIVAVCPLCDSGHPSYRSPAMPIPVSGRRGDTLGSDHWRTMDTTLHATPTAAAPAGPHAVSRDSALATEAARRRTFAVISHPDAGKSTLT